MFLQLTPRWTKTQPGWRLIVMKKTLAKDIVITAIAMIRAFRVNTRWDMIHESLILMIGEK